STYNIIRFPYFCFIYVNSMSFIIYETWREIKMIFYNESVKKNNYQNFGRRFVSEMLMPQLLELENEYEEAKHDKDFLKDLSHYLKQYIGRPTPLYEAKNLTSYLGRGRIFLKREDLNHIGSHKINNAIGQARSEEHTSELQSRFDLVCRLLLEKKKKTISTQTHQ